MTLQEFKNKLKALREQQAVDTPPPGGVVGLVTGGTPILNLKRQLESSDYKIIKCAEYQLAGLELPYDIVELNAARQDIRNKINELEAQ